ncbi:N-acetylmuramoyl-L-alanine amidase [Thalassovita aquimarina]|uniref:N-acetylmuramoyl-L-alanine amidase n=1 Tax=Thalassovita aquimarina TaxID=2785917 RepID=A0ABS5HTL0_9RHOB|nr:N-acetylmuramoyl-L-alanine amidase [Thalassovita aquimarina]MBR9651933.1 N-acetylmuramoyl-L-alanine amidase [Thalassovita aquimarina]
MKLAIVVGHNARAQGAVRPDTGETEFVWNTDLARIIEDEAAHFDEITVKTFFREAGLGYSREIRDVYARTDRWGADATCELHFNSHHTANATGTETLSSGSALSLAFAMALQERMLDALGLKDRGEKIVRKGRGAASLISGRAPAALIEPFFGSSPEGQAATDEAHEKRVLARAILLAAQDAFL